MSSFIGKIGISRYDQDSHEILSQKIESLQLNDFSDEVLELILTFLLAGDLLSLSKTNRHFHRLCSDGRLWKLVLDRLDLNLEKPNSELSAFQIHKNYRAFGKRLQLMRLVQKIEKHRSFAIDLISSFGHVTSIVSMNGYLYSNFCEGFVSTIRRWDDRGECIQILRNTFLQEVSSLSAWKDHIYSGGWDGTVRKWGEDGTSTLFQTQSRRATCLIGYKESLCSASGNFIRMWDEEGHDRHFLDAQAIVICFAVLDDFLCSGCADGRILQWNDEGKCLMTLFDRTYPIHTLTLFKGQLCSGYNSKGTICTWNREGKVALSFKGHSAGVSCLSEYDGHLFSASKDWTIRIWDKDAKCLRILRTRVAVCCFSIFKGYLVLGGEGRIRLFAPFPSDFSRSKEIYDKITHRIIRLIEY